MAVPNLAVHSLQSDQRVQVQYCTVSHRVVQSETSLASFASHLRPQWLAICLMARLRKRWSPHFKQAPHWDQSPQRQSTHVAGAQGCVEHGCVSSNDVSQGLPPFVAGERMWRDLSTLPPPHVTGHGLQVDHWPTWQSTTWFVHTAGAAPRSPGLQGSTSLSAVSLQTLPLPRWKCSIFLCLSRTPKQVLLQADHWFQAETLQS
mmetsp:Transcript_15053/g.31431  ORF Transcript_15053/g.31431 Transcript_15053/m.31431 type:complete len:204 (-) Transcript_15053:2563-3174(-)